jgi:uncharacterized protein
MLIYIQAKPRSKKEYVRQIDANHFVVAVHDPPVDGKANKAIMKTLAEYFHKPTSQICIIRGETAKHKVVEIPLKEEEIKEFLLQNSLF